MSIDVILKECPLGKKTPYISEYAPELLFAISRQATREAIQIPHFNCHGNLLKLFSFSKKI